MTKTKPAVVRYYIDADLLGLGKILAAIRSDVTYPGDQGATIHKRIRPPCRLQPGMDDVEWIPVAAAAGWLIITRDSAIQDHRAEIDAVMSHGGKMVALAGKKATNNWAQLEIVMTQWRAIEALADRSGPFVFELHRTSMHQVAP